MQRRSGFVACIILMLCLPLASPGAECAEEAGLAAEPRNALRDVIPGRDDDAASPLSSPTIRDAYRPYPVIERFEGATPSEPFRMIGGISLWESEDVPISPVQHRGDLVLDPSALNMGTGRACFGPDTPPPSTGDWLVDGSGNIVDNTTVVLNGNLKVTTGDIILDNVSLIMNCVSDGQYEINVSAGGVLNLMNCNITAFSGALHYKFIVNGEMTMDRCSVSEMWGDSHSAESGISISSNAVEMLCSVVSGGEFTGVFVSGASECRISNCTMEGNTGPGLAVAYTAAPTIRDCRFNDNLGNGVEIFHSAKPVFVNCVAEGNRWSGIGCDGTSAPRFLECSALNNSNIGMGALGFSTPVWVNCTSAGNSAGILADDTSSPWFANCSAAQNSVYGIQVAGSARPVFSDCTATGNGDHGITVMGNSRPSFSSCSAADNSMDGIAIAEWAQPAFLDCVSTGNKACGLSAMNYSIAVLTDCAFDENAAMGVKATEDSQAILSNCTLAGNGRTGFFASGGSAGRLSNCSLAGHAQVGIYVMDSASTEFRNCEIKNNGEGIRVEGSSGPDFTGCTATGNSGHGIGITNNSMPVFTDCISKDNNWSGITVGGSSAPKLADCSATGNNWSGIITGGTSRPVLTNCTCSNNADPGLSILEGSGPRMEGLFLSGNGGQNLWLTSSEPVLLPNSTLAGGSSLDIQLGNGSRLTLLNTTYTSEPLVGPDAQLKVQWYLSFRILDRANRPLAGAVVDGAGRNGSRIQAVQSGRDGMATDLVATEYLQNGSTAEQERTCYAPYDLSVTVDGETNTTSGIPADRTLSWRLYFDHAPRFSSLPDTLVTEDQPTVIDLSSHLSDQDDPISRLGLSTDRDYVVPDNATHTLVVNCPYHIESDVVTVTVSDGIRNSTQALALQIIPVNDRPACRKPIPDLEAVEDETLTVDLAEYMWDEESGGRLTFTCNFEEIAIDNLLRQASWTPGEGNSSLAAVVFSAWDGYLEGASNAFNITFIRVNDAPVYLGGLADATVEERRNWTLDLRSCFWDEEDTGGLKFEASNPAVVIDNLRHAAFWSPSGNAGFSIEVQFTAHDASNYTMTAETPVITLTYLPVNDPPEFLGTLKGARLKLGEEWNITLEEYFRDDDTGSLRFSSNNPNVKIIELNKTRHCAVWRPDRYSSDIAGLVFTAYDGRTYTRSDPITLDFEAPADVEKPPPVTNIILRIPLYVYILLPAGILAGVAAFYAYRRVKYGKYTVEQVFLVNKDGRLLAHKSRMPHPGGGEDIISGMLTALQGFIKEFMRDEKQGELEEMKYGDLKILIERGKRIYLAVFLSGYVTDELKAIMKRILAEVETEMGAVLESWDGTVKMLEGMDKHLLELIKEEKAPSKEGR